MIAKLTENRASLITLPAELLSKIYSYVFAGISVQLPKSHDHGLQGVNGLRNNQLLSLQLVSTFFAVDPDLYREYFRSLTVVVSSQADLEELKRKLWPAQLSLIRHVCICARDFRTPKRTPSAQTASGYAHHSWTSLDVPSLITTFPNLRTLSVKQSGVYIDTFRQDLPFSVAELLAAQEHAVSNRQSHGQRDVHYNHGLNSIPSVLPGSKAGQQHFLTNRTLIPKVYLEQHSEYIVSCFANTLSACIERTAPKLDPNWYCRLIQAAVANGIEMVFSLSLLFTGVKVDDEAWFEDIEVSSKDWMLRLKIYGHEHAFPQTLPEGLTVM